MLTFTITSRIKIPYINKPFDDFVYGSLTMINPKWIENNRLSRFNRKTPKELQFYTEEGEETETELYAPRGFLIDILQYCKINNISIEIENKTHIYEDINWEFSGGLRPFQKIAIDKILSQNEGVLCAPTGSGKTVMAINIIARRKQPAIIIVHTKELLNQWQARLKSFLKIKARQIGFIGDGKLQDDRDIAIAMIQTLAKYPEIVNNYGFMIIDEVHHCPSRTFTEAVKEFQGRYILGLSATPYRRDGLTKVINWYCGPTLHEISSKSLIKSGDITRIDVIIRRTDFIASMEDPSVEYSKLMQEISQDHDRNLMIIEDIWKAVGEGHACLILSDRKAHCYKLKELIGNLWAVEVLTGETHLGKRKQIVRDINDGKIEVLIATSQLIGEGFDCKNLSALFLTMPIRFSGRVIQYLGRVLRPAKDKDKALVYDYFDQSVRCLYSGFKTRQKEYEKLKGE